MNGENILIKLKKVISIEHCVVRFFMAWCFICIIQTITVWGMGTGIDELEYVKLINIPVMTTCVIIIMSVLYSVFYMLEKKNKEISRKIEGRLLVILTFVYASICAIQNDNIYFVIALVALVSMSIVYYIRYAGVHNVVITRKTYMVIVLITAIIYIAFVSFCMVTRYLSYYAPNYDMGLFSQMFYYMKTTGIMQTTSERDYLMSHMCVHISPVFYLILPLYMIFSSPVMLEIIQPVLVAAAVIPLALICRNRKLSRWETALIIIMYCFYPVMSGGCFYDIHENMFFPLLLSLFLLFMEKDNMVGMCIFAVLVWIIKEDASVLMMFVGLYMMFDVKMRKKGAILFVLSAVYCLFACTLLKYIGAGVVSGRYNNMIPDGDGNMFSVIKTVFVNPVYLITQMFAQDNIIFIFQTMGVLLFLPLMTRKWSRYILIGPYVLFNLVPDYQYMHSIYFHYVFGSGMLLIYLVVLNISDMNMNNRMKMLYIAVTSSMIFFMAYNIPKLGNAIDYFEKDRQEIYRTMDDGLAVIPDDASVVATTFLCTHLSQRKELYELYYTDKSAEYIAIDLRNGSEDYDEQKYMNNSRYETVYYSKDAIVVFRDTFY